MNIALALNQSVSINPIENMDTLIDQKDKNNFTRLWASDEQVEAVNNENRNFSLSTPTSEKTETTTLSNVSPLIKNAKLRDLLGSNFLLKGVEKEFDKSQNPPTPVGDLVSNIQDLEKFIALLKEALVRAMQPDAKAESCMEFVEDGFAEIKNPNLALEAQLNSLVSRKVSPVTESYAKYKDRMIAEGKINQAKPSGYFYFAFGVFFRAGILYKHHIRAMDPQFYNLMNNSKDDELPFVPTKSALIDKEINSLATEEWRKSMSHIGAKYRRKVV